MMIPNNKKRYKKNEGKRRRKKVSLLTLLNSLDIFSNVVGRLRTIEMEKERLRRDELVKIFNYLKVLPNLQNTSVVPFL